MSHYSHIFVTFLSHVFCSEPKCTHMQLQNALQDEYSQVLEKFIAFILHDVQESGTVFNLAKIPTAPRRSVSLAARSLCRLRCDAT